MARVVLAVVMAVVVVVVVATNRASGGGPLRGLIQRSAGTRSCRPLDSFDWKSVAIHTRRKRSPGQKAILFEMGNQQSLDVLR